MMTAVRPNPWPRALAFSIAALALSMLCQAPATAQATAGEAIAALPAHASGQRAAPPGAALLDFRAPGESSAVAFQLGDRFHGPGILDIGRRGTRKQLVLPAGDWVLLAAIDHASGNGVVDLATLRFGRFAGRRLQTMLSFTLTPNGTSTRRWAELDQCNGGSAHALLHATSLPSAARSECVVTHASAGVRLAEARGGGDALASLERLGASHGGPALVSHWHFADRRGGYLHVSRIDWLHVTYGDDSGPANDWQPAALATSADRQAHARALQRWVEGYRTTAAAGFERHFDLDSLAPGQRLAQAEADFLPNDVTWPPRGPAP